MKISDLRAVALSSPIEPRQERKFHAGVRTLCKRDVVLMWLETADGSRGFAPAGASSSAMREYFEDDSQGEFAALLDGQVADEFSGERIESVEALHNRVAELNFPDRLRMQIASALDIAYYDLRGQAVGAPIYELLAERTSVPPTTTLPLYASAGMYMEPAEYAKQAATADELGFWGYKYRPGIGPDEDRKTINRVSDAVTDAKVLLDSHTWWKMGPRQRDYDEETIADLVRYANDTGAAWIEEPVAPDDRTGYIRLAETGAPLAGGESEDSPTGLIELAETGAVSYLQGDVRHHGGYTGCWDVVEHCEGTGVEFVPHNFGTWLGLVANAHLAAAAPESRLHEYPLFENDPLLDSDHDPGMYPFDLAFDVIHGTPDVTDGTLSVPDAPGLGVDVDLDVVETYPFIEGPWTEFLYDEA